MSFDWKMELWVIVWRRKNVERIQKWNKNEQNICLKIEDIIHISTIDSLKWVITDTANMIVNHFHFIIEMNQSSKSWETIISNIRWSLWGKYVTFDNVLFNQQVEESEQETNNQWNNRELTTLMNEIDSFELLRMEKIFKCNWSSRIGWFRENNKNLLLSWKTSKIE